MRFGSPWEPAFRGRPSSKCVAFGYDSAKRQIWEEQTLAGYPTRRVETPRDADGNRRSLNVAGWFSVLYDYTQRNQLDHIYGGGGASWFDYTYDAAGNLTKRQDVLSGVNDSINVPPQWYDPLNRPVMWENTGAGDVPFARSWYQYDKVGREVATWRDEQGSKGERFYYSTTNQLSNVRYNADHVSTGNPSNWDRWVDYGYTPDRLNRWYVNDNGNFAWMGANALNQYTSLGGAALAYDERFNLRLHGGYQYDYDAANRLVSGAGNGQSAGFVYDGLGRCVKRTVNGAVTVIAYDGWKPTVEWSELGSRDIGGLAERPSERERTSQWAGDDSYYAYNVYGAGPDEILWRYDSRPGYGHLRYHHDRHGNVTSLLNEHGSIIEKYSYDAFGAPKVTDPSGNDRKIAGRYASWYANRFLFQGREWIRQLGIYDYRHRMYHPQLGRFLQTDPIGLQTEGEKLSAGQKALFWAGQAPEAFSSSEMNLFRYCGDDPVNHTDPLGLVPPADGLVDVPRDVLRSQFKAGQANAADSSNPAINKDTEGRKVEFRRDGYKKDGAIKDGVSKGYWERGTPKANQPKNPNSGKRVYITHSHVTGSHRHLPHDKDVADRGKVPSGVTYSGYPNYMEVYVPRADGGGRGGTFYTRDGINLFDKDRNEVPH